MILWFALCTALPAAQSPALPPQQLRLAQEIQITGDAIWVDTGIDINPGERLQLSATGTLRYA
jgi:hypothetical protein